jgi:AcrR family transcriptional regulator
MSPRINLDLNIILKIAAEIADTQGVEAVTLAALAKKLNIKSPSLYNHFDGMSGLRAHLAAYGVEELYNTLVTATIGRASDEAVHRLAQAYVSFVRKHPGIYEAMNIPPALQNEQFQNISKKTVDLVICVLDPYKIKKDNEIHIVRGFRSMLHGFASLEQKGGFGIPLSPDDSLKIMVDTYLAGIRSLNVLG